MKNRFTIIFLICLQLVVAQTKQEHERRIKANGFPEPARQLIDDFSELIGTVRYYQETDGDHQSYEAKFRFNGSHYSVEFDSEGGIEDLEIRVQKGEIPEEMLGKIDSALSKTYRKWKLEKIQLQYRPIGQDRNFLKEVLNGAVPHPPRFEIIVLTKQQGKVTSYEYLFGPDGEMIKKRKVVRRSHGFILF